MPQTENLDATFMLIHRDTFLWIVGLSAVAIGGFVFEVLRKLDKIIRGEQKLLDIHTKEKADDYGFGTVKIGEDMKKMHKAQEDQTRAVRSLARVMHWTARKQFGEEPPPLDLE